MPEYGALIYVGAMLLCGLVFGRIFKFLRCPNVTGYLIAGLIFGPYVLHLIPVNVVTELHEVCDMALAFIAFTIGCGFKLSYFRQVGMMPIVVAIFEGLGAVLVVDLSLILTGHDLAFSLVLGAIASATDPAATLLVAKQYNAKGPVTDTLLSVVAIDDAIALMAFSISVAAARVISGNMGDTGLAMSILAPFLEILFALIIGAVFALLACFLMHFFHKQTNRIIIIAGVILSCAALTSVLKLSPLLACMMTGLVFCNLEKDSDQVRDMISMATPPIFVLFFVLSGAGLNIALIPMIGFTGLVYVVMRCPGKMLGAWFGAKIMGAPKNVRRYIGPALIPQAGVAIGLTLVAQSAAPQYAQQLSTIILCSTIIYEIVGPIITKIALKKAGEIEEPKKAA